MNASDHTIAAATPLPEKPYVGMRPFNPGEKDIFIGRGRDAVLLRDKVFSSRLTVLYGPSGIGKSSILRVLLIPELEEKKSRVIYFDDWRTADPTAALKEKLVAEAASLNIPSREQAGRA
jgi:hypothetical protein